MARHLLKCADTNNLDCLGNRLTPLKEGSEDHGIISMNDETKAYGIKKVHHLPGSSLYMYVLFLKLGQILRLVLLK